MNKPAAAPEPIAGEVLRDRLIALAGKPGELGAKARAAILAELKEVMAEGRAAAEKALIAERQGHRLRPPPLRPPGRDHRRALRPRRRPRPRAGRPQRRRAHDRDGGRRLRPRHAGARLRRRSPVPAPLQADAVGRDGRRVHPLFSLGPRPEGRPRHAQRLRMHAPVALRHDHPHRHPRGALTSAATGRSPTN